MHGREKYLYYDNVLARKADIEKKNKRENTKMAEARCYSSKLRYNLIGQNIDLVTIGSLPIYFLFTPQPFGRSLETYV